MEYKMLGPAKIPLVFLLITFSILVVQIECLLSSQFSMSKAIEEAKGKLDTEKDQLSRQITDGVAFSKETTSICGLVGQEQRYGQGLDLQPVHRNVNTCHITTFQAVHKHDQRIGTPCKVPQMCIANESSVEELTLLDGQMEITSAITCQCIDPHPPCHRQSNRRVYHWGTKYGKIIDVGRCVGSCNKKGKKTCQPIASKIVNVKGPNGAHCVEKVVKCGCARSCYRASFHQLYSATIFDEQTGTNKTLEQDIDVGHCVGQCSKRKKARCLHWVDNPLWRPGSAAPSKVCMISSPPEETEAKCRPRSFGTRVLFPGNGASKTVNVIKRCKCY